MGKDKDRDFNPYFLFVFGLKKRCFTFPIEINILYTFPSNFSVIADPAIKIDVPLFRTVLREELLGLQQFTYDLDVILPGLLKFSVCTYQ